MSYGHGIVNKPDGPAATSVMYDAMADNWRTALDLLGGTQAMRCARERYLPKEPAELSKAYDVRLNRSRLFNGFKGAIEKAVSYPFSKDVELIGADNLPASLGEDPEADVDGSGTPLTLFARNVFEGAVALGHCFVFVNHDPAPPPKAGEVPSRADEKAAGIRSRWTLIQAPDMLSWTIDPRTGKPTEVRFRVVRVEKQDKKKWVDEEREYVHVWRADGTWQIWRSDKAVRQEDSIVGTYLKTRVVDCTTAWCGQFRLVKEGRHTYPGIPIVPVYSKKTGEFMSEPPFIELADTNIEHWQSSSDQRNILRFARLAQKVATGTTAADMRSDNLKASVHNVMWFKNADAKVYYLEHGGAGIQAGERDLDRLEMRMAAQGLQPLTQRTVDQTATGTMVDLMNVSSDAQAWVKLSESGIRSAFEVAARWTNGKLPEDFAVQIHSDFAMAVAGSADFPLVEAIRRGGDLDRETYLLEAQRRSIIAPNRSVEDIIEKIEAEGAMAGGPLGAADGSSTGSWKLGPGAADGHEHSASLDEGANGKSSPAPDGHVHEVVAGEVMPAGPDSHVHELIEPADDAPEEEEEEEEEKEELS